MATEALDANKARNFGPASAVAERLGVSTKTVHRWAAGGKLTRYTVPGTQIVRFDMAEVDRLLSRSATGPDAA
jgi:excisionase family DNA binding protein